MIGTTSTSGVSAGSDDIVIGSIDDNTTRGITFATTDSAAIRWADAGDNAMGRIAYSNSTDVMTFHTSNATRLRLDSDGMKFGSDSAAANALDDYEEGTFTVTLANSLTVGQQTTLSYTKIGNKVHISGQFKVTSGGSDLIVSNLPFTTKNTGSTDETFSSGICGLYNVTFPTDGSASGEILTKTQKNDTNLYFVYNRTGNDPNQHTATTNGYYTVSHWYTAA